MLLVCRVSQLYVILSTFLLFFRFSVLVFRFVLLTDYLGFFSTPFFFHLHTEVFVFYSYFFTFPYC
jgi:hypothetical protein